MRDAMCPCPAPQLMSTELPSRLPSGSPTARDSARTPAGPPEPAYFLLTVIQVLRQVSEFGRSASAIVKLGCLPPVVRVLGIVSDFRESVVLHILELLWNVLEHSYSVLGECGALVEWWGDGVDEIRGGGGAGVAVYLVVVLL